MCRVSVFYPRAGKAFVSAALGSILRQKGQKVVKSSSASNHHVNLQTTCGRRTLGPTLQKVPVSPLTRSTRNRRQANGGRWRGGGGGATGFDFAFALLSWRRKTSQVPPPGVLSLLCSSERRRSRPSILLLRFISPPRLFGSICLPPPVVSAQ